MTIEERDQLQQFLRQLVQTRASKDAIAEAMIKEACAQQPDALYILVQRAMNSERALYAARSQETQSQQQLSKKGTTDAQTTIIHTAAGVVAGAFLFEGIADIFDDSIDF